MDSPIQNNSLFYKNSDTTGNMYKNNSRMYVWSNTLAKLFRIWYDKLVRYKAVRILYVCKLVHDSHISY